jgi:hypothetical protein
MIDTLGQFSLWANLQNSGRRRRRYRRRDDWVLPPRQSIDLLVRGI